MSSHSRFAPSATERETLCPPSFLLSEGLPDKNSFHSAHGTSAHHVGYLCLAHDHDVEFYVGCLIAVTDKGECRFIHEGAPARDEERVFEVDDEMVTNVQAYVDWVRQVPGDHYYEVRVEHTPWCPDEDEHGFPLDAQFGTSDDIACEPGVLTVTDLKYGKGVKVFAEKNKQAIKYALGAWLMYNWIYDFKKVVVRIAQPRLDHFDVWECTIEELLEYGREIKAQLTEVFNPNAPFAAGEKQCRFCKVSARCPALKEHLSNVRGMGFDDETKRFTAADLLTNEDLEEAYRNRKLFDIRFDAIEREIARALRCGEEMPGLKLVQGRTHRRWKDELEVRAFLRSVGVPRDKMVKETLISPNQTEKLLPVEHRHKIDDLWERPAGGPAIVDASDDREPFTGVLANGGFDDETVAEDGFGD